MNKRKKKDKTIMLVLCITCYLSKYTINVEEISKQASTQRHGGTFYLWNYYYIVNKRHTAPFVTE